MYSVGHTLRKASVSGESVRAAREAVSQPRASVQLAAARITRSLIMQQRSGQFSELEG
jgi:hypothetical protein